MNARRREFKDRIVKMFGELKQHVEPAEWEAVFEGMEAMDEKWEELGR